MRIDLYEEYLTIFDKTPKTQMTYIRDFKADLKEMKILKVEIHNEEDLRARAINFNVVFIRKQGGRRVTYG